MLHSLKRTFSRGTIVTADELDREKTAMYSLQVETRSRNPDQHLYWTLVQVTVMDVNDNAPIFTDPQPIRLRLSIDDIEQLSGNMIIGKIGVEDADADDNGRLELRIMPPHNKLFAISNEGILSVNGDFTAAHFGEHDLTVVARDHGEPSLETRARVQISIFGTLITMATVAPTVSSPVSSRSQLQVSSRSERSVRIHLQCRRRASDHQPRRIPPNSHHQSIGQEPGPTANLLIVPGSKQSTNFCSTARVPAVPDVPDA